MNRKMVTILLLLPVGELLAQECMPNAVYIGSSVAIVTSTLRFSASTVWTPGPSTPGECPDTPCQFTANLSIHLFVTGTSVPPPGPIDVQACVDVPAPIYQVCGPFPVPVDVAAPGITQIAEGPFEWSVPCGGATTLRLEYDSPLGSGWEPLATAILTCLDC
ncbi:MAG: hypothetical protein KF830_18895 [Planctomycetes bacterium]|nr:hypothetical protein [Planctomycetota bacterium]